MGPVLARVGSFLVGPKGHRPPYLPRLEVLDNRVTPATLSAQFPVGFGAGTGGVQAVVDLQTNGRVVATPSPIPGFTGAIRRATADFTGDGTPDTVWAEGPGGGPRIRIISGADGSVLADFFAFAPGFTGGVYVATGDVNGDGTPDLIVGAGSGAGSPVIVIDGTKLNQVQANGQISNSALLASFYAFGPGFTGGVTVAAGDFNGDGKSDVVVGAGPGAGPRVIVIDGTKLNQLQTNGQISDSALLGSFFAFRPAFAGGVTVVTGDVNGDGTPDVVVGAGPGAGPGVVVIDGTKLNQVVSALTDALNAHFNAGPLTPAQIQAGEIDDSALLASFYAYDVTFTGGVRVDALDVDGDGKADIVTGAGPGAGPHVRVFRATDLAILDSFFATSPTFTGGVNV